MAKVKKMGLGGFFGGLLGGGAKGITKAVSKSPVVKAIAGGAGTLAKPPIKAIAGGVGAIKKPSPGLTGAATAAGTKGIGSAVRGAGSMVKPAVNVARGALGTLAKGRGMKSGGATKKMAAGGLTAGHKDADGIASKGKTKAKAVKMAKGGRTC